MSYRAQRFKSGDVLNDWSADLLNNMGRAAEMVLNMKVQAPLTMTQTGDRLTLGVGVPSDFQRQLTDVRTVVVVNEPAETDTMVLVQQVGYFNQPPEPCKGSTGEVACKISFMLSPFAAYPEFGLRAADYRDSFWNRANGTPDETADYYHARNENGYWLLDPPAKGGAEFKSVRLVVNPTPTIKTLTVVEVYENEDGATVDRRTEEGALDQFTARTLHNYVGRHYQRFFGRTPQMALPCAFFDGDWRVIPLDRFVGKVPNAIYQAGQCSTG
jgi:hypothetical protein